MAGERGYEAPCGDDGPTRWQHDACQLNRHCQQHTAVWHGQRTDLHTEKPCHSVTWTLENID